MKYHSIEKAINSARTCASRGGNEPDKNKLISRGYTPEAADAYILAYNKAIKSPEQQRVRKIQNAGRNAAHNGCDLSRSRKLQNYTPDEQNIYLKAFNKSEGSRHTQKVRRAKKIAQRSSRIAKTADIITPNPPTFLPRFAKVAAKIRQTNSAQPVFLPNFSMLVEKIQESEKQATNTHANFHCGTSRMKLS